MARPREFEIDDALAKALDVFWEHGYANASLPDLLEGMGLTRGSLYKAFTDKQTLFLRVLEKYDTQSVNDAVVLLTSSDQGGWARIFQLFDTVEAAVRNGDQRGCLLCSAIAGPAAYDNDIEKLAYKSLNRLQKAFQEALRDVVPSADAPALSHLLITQYIGIRIVARTNNALPAISQSIAALKTMERTLS